MQITKLVKQNTIHTHSYSPLLALSAFLWAEPGSMSAHNKEFLGGPEDFKSLAEEHNQWLLKRLKKAQDNLQHSNFSKSVFIVVVKASFQEFSFAMV